MPVTSPGLQPYEVEAATKAAAYAVRMNGSRIFGALAGEPLAAQDLADVAFDDFYTGWVTEDNDPIDKHHWAAFRARVYQALRDLDLCRELADL